MSLKAKDLFKWLAYAMEPDEEPLSNCCSAPFTYPGWPDSDFCSECHEHADIDDEDDDIEARTIGVEDGKN